MVPRIKFFPEMHLGLICHVYPPATHGGIGSSNQDLAEGLAANGHRVTAVGFYSRKHVPAGKENRATSNGVNVVRLLQSPSWMRFKPRALWERWRLKRWLEREHAKNKFDLIEFSDYGGWLPWGGPKNVPVVSRLQGTNAFFDSELGREGNKFEHKLEIRSLLGANFWLGISDYSLRRTLELCNLTERPSGVIHHAVDTEFFSPGPESEVEPGLIVFVNWINPKKGVEQLIDAANLLFAKNSQAKLVLIGQESLKSSNGVSYRDQLINRLRPEFRMRVHFAGRLPRREILPWLRMAEVCCYPSHAETFGIAPVEAMAVGRPTIFSKTGPGPEVIEDGVSGLLCDPHDPADIAQKIELLLKDSCLAEKLGQNGRMRALALFNKRDWIQRNLAFFEQCCGHV